MQLSVAPFVFTALLVVAQTGKVYGNSMKHFILGTAGHIDHGKTALVKALTGVDTDRLPEEKSRGITIELGFAGFDLPGGIHFGVVDVPGHEKFVRTMVAGVGGMDLVMLVIAADEGVMPQTREHLDICQLLGVRRGLVVLSKCDLVTTEWLDLVVEEVREFVADSFLAAAPIVPVSAKSGQGIAELTGELAAIAHALEQKKCDGAFRLPVDRVFTVAGFGTVVTGTLLSGTVAVGDDVELLPAGLSGRIRGIQAHGAPALNGEAGSRMALNIQGVEHSQVKRGDVVVPRGAYRTTRIVDVVLNHLASAPRPLKNRALVRLHSSAYEVPAVVMLLDRDTLEPGGSAYAQLRLARPALLLHGDPFVLRLSSPAATIAGGSVLDPFPPGRRRRSHEALELLGNLTLGSGNDIIAGMVEGALLSGINHEELAARSGMPPKRLDAALAGLLTAGAVVQVVREPKKYLSRDAFGSLCGELYGVLNDYCERNPLKEGIGKEELKTRLPSRSDERVFTPCLAALAKEGKIVVERDLVRLVGRKAGGSAGAVDCAARILAELAKAGKEPPFVSELCATLKLSEKELQDHLALLVSGGGLIKVKGDIYYCPEPLAELEAALIGHLKEFGEITPPEFRERTGLSRKFMIPLLEYFDAQKVTIRLGDKRVLRKR